MSKMCMMAHVLCAPQAPHIPPTVQTYVPSANLQLKNCLILFGCCSVVSLRFPTTERWQLRPRIYTAGICSYTPTACKCRTVSATKWTD